MNGVPPAHPSWDRVWSAAVALGMTPMLHTGFERMRFDPGWANLGGDVTLLRMVGSAHRHVAPMTLLYALIYSGVFERFPTLTLLLAEVGTGWLPFLFREIDDRISPTAELFLGKWKLPLRPSEYLARNVRATPLSGGNDSPLAEDHAGAARRHDRVLVGLPALRGLHAIRSAHYAEALKELPPARRERFFGGSIADVYARMGDPLAVA